MIRGYMETSKEQVMRELFANSMRMLHQLGIPITDMCQAIGIRQPYISECKQKGKASKKALIAITNYLIERVYGK
jgi:hypothetical protein